jgi:hypothetical protein
MHPAGRMWPRGATTARRPGVARFTGRCLVVDRIVLPGTSAPAAAHRRRASIGELAPSWILVLSGLLVGLTGVGFFAGRASVPEASANVAPTPSGTSPSDAASPSPSPSPSTVAATGPADGRLLGSYTFTMPGGYAVPLTDSAPAPSEFVPNNTGGDLVLLGQLYSFVPGSTANHLYGLDGNAEPTFQRCRTSALVLPEAHWAKGTTFCLSTPTRMFGITVTATSSSPYNATLSLVVWQDSSS